MAALTFVDGHKRNVAIRFGMNFRIISLIVTFNGEIQKKMFFLIYFLLFSGLLVTYLLRSNITENFTRL